MYDPKHFLHFLADLDSTSHAPRGVLVGSPPCMPRHRRVKMVLIRRGVLCGSDLSPIAFDEQVVHPDRK